MSRRWLLIPMCPTPNGRLHIGHGGGPYLRADAIARALRREGHHATVISGTDAYENWVLADALATGRTPEETCREYHAAIKHDLDNLGIEFDAWIDPLAAEHREPYIRLHEQLLDTLTHRGVAVFESERIPVGIDTGRELLGVWIAGICPSCGADAGGNTCTACGDHFPPEDLLQPRSRLVDEPITWTQRSSWFARPAETTGLLDALAATGLPNRFLAAPRRYLGRGDARIRLSQPGPWGITTPLLADNHVLANTYYAYSRYCGQVYATQHSTTDPFLADSDVTVVGLFGTDNSIAGLLAPHVLADRTGYKPFDHTVLNHMLHFHGRKCSTSKRHGIQITDLIDHTSLTPDELRYCLAQAPLDHDVADIDTATIVAGVNELRRWWTHRVEPALAQLTTPTAPDAELLRTAATYLDRQARLLTPPTIDLTAATAIAREWITAEIADPPVPASAAAWLLSAALLLAPITPDSADHLWTALGLDHPILASAISVPYVYSAQRQPLALPDISQREIDPFILIGQP